ncbi:hypothetical protein ACIRPU_41540 [Streptomyces sp. NPDC102259]|uniref:hypothetical protein n=1 Tax=Streptomyces sp. NPDC102259 TaxID=3366148 RepID=UPI00380209A1
MMIASYSADLADDHGRWIRDAINTWGDDLGIQLKAGSQAANRFDIVGGEGGLLAAGIGGGLTGRGAHIAIVTTRSRTWPMPTAPPCASAPGTGGPPYCRPDSNQSAPSASSRLAGTKTTSPDASSPPSAMLGGSSTCPPSRTASTTRSAALLAKRYGQNASTPPTTAKPARDVWAALYLPKPRPPEGGVWKREWIETARINAVQFSGVDMARIVVAVEPAGGETTVGDETGAIGVGRDFDRQLYVLADRSGSMGAND